MFWNSVIYNPLHVTYANRHWTLIYRNQLLCTYVQNPRCLKSNIILNLHGQLYKDKGYHQRHAYLQFHYNVVSQSKMINCIHKILQNVKLVLLLSNLKKGQKKEQVNRYPVIWRKWNVFNNIATTGMRFSSFNRQWKM